MAKKKTKSNAQQLTPEKYIKTKARALPIFECLASNDWQNSGLAQITVTREFKSGNFLAAVYLVDTFCLGVKNSFFKFNCTPEEYNELTEYLYSEEESNVIPYEEAHNIIYGAISYAEEIGFEPHKSFALTQYILEEDTEDIPLIEYEFGHEGKPFLITTTPFEASKYIPTLDKNVGEGNYKFLITDENPEEEDFDDGEDFNSFDDDDDFDDEKIPYDIADKEVNYIETQYMYNAPYYPEELHLTHPELNELYKENYFFTLPENIINTILQLPRESLTQDLNNIILHETGLAIRRLENKTIQDDNDNHTAMMHALFLLGELRAEESLDVILEVVRQHRKFNDIVFGDTGPDILPLTLYYVGKNQIDKLLDYAKEPNLDAFSRIYAFDAIGSIAINEPERRTEVIEWYRTILHYFHETNYNADTFDTHLIGMAIHNLLDIKAKELLPEIKYLYDNHLVETVACGHYYEVEEDIFSNKGPVSDYKTYNIYDRYKHFEESWNRN